MGGTPSSNQTVTNRTEIDPVTQAWRSQIMGAGNALYQQGTPAYYPGNTVVPFSDQTQMGLNYLQGQAQMGAPGLGEAYDASSRAMSGWNPAMPYAQGVAQGGLYGNPATQQLEQFGGATNPHLDAMWRRGAEQVGNAVNSNFAQAGRYGANAAHTGALTQGLGDLYTQIHAPAYEAERNRGLSAAQTMGGLYDSGANRTLSGIDLMGSMHAQGNADAARASALLPSLYGYGQMPGQAMMDIGGIYESQAGQYLSADQDRYNYNANAPWQYLQQYAGMMNGLPDFSGSTQSQSGRAGTNRLMQGLGAASAGLGIWQALGAMGGGGAAGALGGGAGALLPFIMSDRRLKREIARIGSYNGTPWYRFAYVWDEPGTVREGVMADEAPAHAVHEHPSGFLMVRYDLL